MDVYFKLSSEDVEEVVREVRFVKSALAESALYNISILDYLLEEDEDAANKMIRSLSSFGERQVRFLHAYISASNKRQQCIEQLMDVSHEVLKYLVNKTELDESLRKQLVNVALAHNEVFKKNIDLSVSKYLLEHYSDLFVLTSDFTDISQAKCIGELFKQAAVSIPSLQPLGEHVRTSFIELSLYDVTYENLSIATGNSDSISLDSVYSASKRTYEYLLNNLKAYLTASKGKSLTIGNVDEAYFSAIIGDVIKQDASFIGEIIEGSSSRCIIENLRGVPVDAWMALAENKRFSATLHNVIAYRQEIGSIDSSLSKLLISGEEIKQSANLIAPVDDDDIENLAVEIINDGEQLPSVPLRMKLLNSLSLKKYVPIDCVSHEEGPLLASLLKHNIILDDVDSYNYVKSLDWSSRRLFILESKKIIDYMSPSLVGDDLASIMQDADFDPAIKQKIIEDIHGYIDSTDLSGVAEIGRFAVKHQYKIPFSAIESMVLAGIGTPLVISLLQPHLDSIDRDKLLRILSQLDSGFQNLAKTGGDKPKIPDTEDNRALLERLRDFDIVSSYYADKTSIKVNKKYV